MELGSCSRGWSPGYPGHLNLPWARSCWPEVIPPTLVLYPDGESEGPFHAGIWQCWACCSLHQKSPHGDNCPAHLLPTHLCPSPLSGFDTAGKCRRKSGSAAAQLRSPALLESIQGIVIICGSDNTAEYKPSRRRAIILSMLKSQGSQSSQIHRKENGGTRGWGEE